jgi:PAS domain-containing protein
VIGAGSVATENVPDRAIVAGNPARAVKRRGEPKRAAVLAREQDALVIRSPDGTIRFWNKGAERLYGCTLHDTLGERSHHLFQTIFPQPLQTIEEELAYRGYWEGELVHLCRDGLGMTVNSRWKMQYDHQAGSDTVIEINTVSS